MTQPDPEPSEVLIQYLEQRSGKRLRTREDIRRYLDELATQGAGTDRRARFWQTLKQGTWFALLAAAYLQYYFLDVFNQIGNMPEVRVHLPPAQMQVKSPPRI